MDRQPPQLLRREALARTTEVLNRYIAGNPREPDRQHVKAAILDCIANEHHSLNLQHLKFSSLPDLSGCGVEVSLHQVESLQLHDNPDLRALPDWIGSMQSLRHLNIGNTPLEYIPDWVHRLSALRTLDLQYTKIRELSDLNHLKHLTEINFRGTLIERVPEWLHTPGVVRRVTPTSVDMLLKDIPEHWVIQDQFCDSWHRKPETTSSLGAMTDVLYQQTATQLPLPLLDISKEMLQQNPLAILRRLDRLMHTTNVSGTNTYIHIDIDGVNRGVQGLREVRDSLKAQLTDNGGGQVIPSGSRRDLEIAAMLLRFDVYVTSQSCLAMLPYLPPERRRPGPALR